jgi:hypothetical protein
MLHITFLIVTSFQIKHHIHLRVDSRQKIFHNYNVLAEALPPLRYLDVEKTHYLGECTRLLKLLHKSGYIVRGQQTCSLVSLSAMYLFKLLQYFCSGCNSHALDELEPLVQKQGAFHPLQLLHHKCVPVSFKERNPASKCNNFTTREVDLGL